MGDSNPKNKIKISIDEVEMEAERKDFKSGRVGYGAYGVIKINSYPYRLSLNIIEM
jgi:hypothetical protein